MLRKNIRELAVSLLHQGSIQINLSLFNQSAVPEHAQLGWVFNCVARMGWRQRMTQL